MILYLVSWFAFSWSVLPPRLDVGIRHDVASKAEGAERIVNAPGVYLAHVSVIRDGRLRPLKLTSRVSED